jgi:CBS domain-containing protein
MPIDAHSPIRDLAVGAPVSVDERLTLRAVAAVLAADAIGTAIVRRPDGSHGIISERDVVQALAAGADPDEVWAADVMTEALVTARVDERVIDVAVRLVAEDIRHVAVFEGDELVGVLSSRDLFRIVTDDLLGA